MASSCANLRPCYMRHQETLVHSDQLQTGLAIYSHRKRGINDNQHLVLVQGPAAWWMLWKEGMNKCQEEEATMFVLAEPPACVKDLRLPDLPAPKPASIL
eukprot:1143628-Pelagomonas_calceolata.AAC.4